MGKVQTPSVVVEQTTVFDERSESSTIKLLYIAAGRPRPWKLVVKVTGLTFMAGPIVWKKELASTPLV